MGKGKSKGGLTRRRDERDEVKGNQKIFHHQFATLT
jgi:hypothetical protein